MAQQQVQIRAKDEDLKGAYSNAMQVAHTQEEFVLDFYNLAPQGNVGALASKVILSPGHMKRMAVAIDDNIKKYEAQFGEIKVAAAPKQEMGFQG